VFYFADKFDFFLLVLFAFLLLFDAEFFEVVDNFYEGFFLQKLLQSDYSIVVSSLSEDDVVEHVDNVDESLGVEEILLDCFVIDAEGGLAC
jgi:hypothetical protein